MSNLILFQSDLYFKKGIHENMKKILFGITSLTIRWSRKSASGHGKSIKRQI